jgi:hypothetical protein
MDEMSEVFGQTIINGTLRWYRSGTGADGAPFEEDGIGFPPEYIRHQLIGQQGAWSVVVDEVINKPAVVRIVRKLLGLDMASSAKLLKEIPGVIYTGTKAEAEWVRLQMKSRDEVGPMNIKVCKSGNQ